MALGPDAPEHTIYLDRNDAGAERVSSEICSRRSAEQGGVVEGTNIHAGVSLQLGTFETDFLLSRELLR